MKANCRFIFLSVIFSFFAFDNMGGDAHARGEKLELYPQDASDPCIDGAQQIRATIYGVTQKGIMKLELYKGNDGFLSGKGRLRSIRDAAMNGPMMMCVNVPEVGEYAIASYHDIDGNRKLKKKWNFTPREPFALSNNPEFKELRKPDFSEAAFYVGRNGADITLNLVDLKALKKKRKAEKKARGDDNDDED